MAEKWELLHRISCIKAIMTLFLYWCSCILKVVSLCTASTVATSYHKCHVVHVCVMLLKIQTPFLSSFLLPSYPYYPGSAYVSLSLIPGCRYSCVWDMYAGSDLCQRCPPAGPHLPWRILFCLHQRHPQEEATREGGAWRTNSFLCSQEGKQ